MNKNLIFAITLLLFVANGTISFAQNVGINATGASPDSSAMLDISAADKGLLIPRMDSTSRMNIVTPAEGLMVFDSTYNSFYFYDGTAWSAIGSGSGGDNLGNHIATQDVKLNGNWLSNDGGASNFEGILIDTSGNVGIRINPTDAFQVSAGKTAETLTINQPISNFQSNYYPRWQSFTAPSDAFLSRFDVSVFSGTPNFTYTLHEGEGVGGAVIASGTSTSGSLTFNDIPIQANQKYTVQLSTPGSVQINISYVDPYSGGTTGIAGRDLTFALYTRTNRSGLLVGGNGVSFESYTFPLSDGTANQALTTNGTGTLGWSSLPFSGYTLPAADGTANQVLSTNGSATLSWTNKSTTILEDTDQNTKIQVEKNPNEDIIRFDLNGQEKWTMQGNRLSSSQPNVLVGQGAGMNVTTGDYIVAVGDSSLVSNTTGSNLVALGQYSMYSNTTGNGNIAIGQNAFSLNTSGSDNIAVGQNALVNNTTGTRNVAIGNDAGDAITTGVNNTLIGWGSGRTISDGHNNVIVGLQAGLNAAVSNSTLIGMQAGFSADGDITAVGRAAGSNSGTGGVFLGNFAGSAETGNDKLYIDNTGTSTPLIWGDFANDILKVHGTFNINDAFSFPTADGANGQVLQTDGAGELSWINNNGTVISNIRDADQNTKIQTEESANENIIRFDINGQEQWTMEGARLSRSQPGVFIGSGAGPVNTTHHSSLLAIGDSSLVNNTTGVNNVGVGVYSLYSNTTGRSNTAFGPALSLNTTGSYNVAVGESALVTNTAGSFNTAIGRQAGSYANSGMSNSTLIGHWAGLTATAGFITAIGSESGYQSGSGGVYLGYQAGRNETGSNKLYIDNSPTSTPLIWGDFANDTLKVHGTFNINNAFSFPTTDGTNGQVLQTDGAGQLTWTTSSGGGGGGTQDLDLIGNTLSLTGDPTTVDLNPYLDADDLGNHTASQNIQLNSNWLSNDGGNEGIRIDDSGKVGIGGAVGTVGAAKLELQGTSASIAAGPHIQVVGSVDDYPLFQQLNFGHGNVSMNFDAYYDGFFRSSSLASNFSIYKVGDYIYNYYDSGIAQGSAISWEKGTSLHKTGRFGIGRDAATNILEVEGNASKSTAGDWLANSDARLKKNITPLSSDDILEKMLSLNGVTYEWNDNKTNTKRPEGIQYGFTAQNIQKVFPSLVTEDNNGFLQTPYGTYDAMTVEAIRALNDKIEKLESEKTNLQSQVQQLQSQNEQLKTNTSELAELKNAFAELKTLLKENQSSISEGVIGKK